MCSLCFMLSGLDIIIPDEMCVSGGKKTQFSFGPEIPRGPGSGFSNIKLSQICRKPIFTPLAGILFVSKTALQ